MARRLRIGIPGGIYHITSCGLERRPIVLDDRDRAKWVELLDRIATRRAWRVFAWALMDNHYHLFLQVPHADLSAGMHDLNPGYVSLHNRRHQRVGPLLQGRFKAILVEEDYHHCELSRYIHLNPVRAKLVQDPVAYLWSSCGQYMGRSAPAPWLAWEEVLSTYGHSVRRARQAYSPFLQEGLTGRAADSPCDSARASTVLGSPGFVEAMCGQLRGRGPDPELPALRTLQHRQGVGPHEVDRAVAQAFRVDTEVLHVRSRRNLARQVAMLLCRRHTSLLLQELGAHYGGISAQAFCNNMRRFEGLAAGDPSLARSVRKAEKSIEGGVKCKV